MSDANLGANEFTFEGYGTRITYFPVAPGPLQAGQEAGGGRLDYHDNETNRTFNGQEVLREETALGTLVTVTLKPNADAGALTATLLVPSIVGVTGDSSVDFETLLIKATSRGFTTRPGPALTYDVVDLKGTAKEVMLPLARESAPSPPSA